MDTDLRTLSAIFSQQISDCMNMVGSMQTIAYNVSQLINQENSIPEVNPQVKSMMGTASIIMQSINAQNVLIQQTIDAISALVN